MSQPMPLLGKGSATKSDEVLEKFQTAFDPPPSFLENYVANFLWHIWLHICEEIWWLNSMKCMHNVHCTWFPEIGTILRGGGGGQLPFGTFPKIHLFWYPDPSRRLAWLLEPSAKCVVFWFFSIHCWKNMPWTLKLLYCSNFLAFYRLKFKWVLWSHTFMTGVDIWQQRRWCNFFAIGVLFSRYTWNWKYK